MRNRLPFQTAIGIFIVVGIAHLVRAILGIEITIGTYHLPVAASVVACVAAFCMAGWQWNTLRKV